MNLSDATALVKQGNFNLDAHLHAVHVALIKAALLLENGNVQRAAIRLGVKRTTLTSRLTSLGIRPH